MNETDENVEDAPVEYVTERFTTGGEGPEGQPHVVDETASLAGRAVAAEEMLNLSAIQPHGSVVETDDARADAEIVAEDAADEAGVQRGVPDAGETKPAAPVKSALKSEWVDYATSLGATDAESLTKDELIEKYGA